MTAIKMMKKPRRKMTLPRVGRILWSIVRGVIVIGICFTILQPLFVKLSVSFMSERDLYDSSVQYIPKHFTMNNYKMAIEGMDYWASLFRTAALSAGVALLQLISCMLTAYGFARFRFPFKKLLFGCVILTLIVPPQIIMLPLFMHFRFFDIFGIFKAVTGSSVSLLDSFWPFIIQAVTCTGFKNGLFIYMLRQFFKGMPRELEEAAFVDGCSKLKTFIRIIVPSSVPMMVTIFLFGFVWQWTDSFYTSLYLKSTNVIPVALNSLATTVYNEYASFGGRTIRIGSYYDMTPDPSKGAIEAALADRIQFVEDNYNCNIEFLKIDGDYVAQYINSVLAGDPICEVGYVTTTTLLPSLIEGGIAYPVSQLDTIDLSEYKWRSDVVEAGRYKGENYAFLVKDPEIRYGIFWNKTLFDKYGLPNLYDLVDSNQWTWDKFQEIASQGNQDTDNDGTIDIYGFNARENLAWNYLYSDGAYVASKTDAGVDIDLGDSRIVEALTALQNFSQNVEYRDSIDWSKEQWNSFITDFRDGKYMMCLEEFWVAYAYFNSDETPMADDWGWVPFPKGPSATDWSCYGKENGARFILNGVDNPAEVAQIYDLITDLADTDEEWDDLMEDKLENWCRDAKTAELVSNIYNNKLSVINGIIGYEDLNNQVNEMVSKVSSGEMTPQTALETYQSAIETTIADLANHDYNADMQKKVDDWKAEEEAKQNEVEGESKAE